MMENAFEQILINEEDRPKTFWALDPQLPLIAAKAAVQLDRLISSKRREGEPIARSYDAIKQLAGFFDGSIAGAEAGQMDKCFVDPVGLTLFAKAYNHSHQAEPVRTKQELQSAAQKLSRALADPETSKNDDSSLASLRDFCVALSDYAANSRKIILGNRQEHPFRKFA